ncbi:hypothetical protein AMECASPLE_038277 [Ameca splendens]|uniref:Uncharacterized protein n=1 Tax=Ameca splendens TaxID=208324 RepID=A0ABV0XL76_9TELE
MTKSPDRSKVWKCDGGEKTRRRTAADARKLRLIRDDEINVSTWRHWLQRYGEVSAQFVQRRWSNVGGNRQTSVSRRSGHLLSKQV